MKSRKYIYLFFAILVAGIVSSVLSKSLLSLSEYQFGPETIGIFIPPFLTTLFMYAVGREHGFSYKILGLSLLLFMLQLLPFWELLWKVVKPNPAEDFERYFQYARHMIRHQTLWGADQIRFPNQSRAYITQPGYRYFVAFELLIFDKLYRFVSLLNIGLFLSAIYFFLKIIHHLISDGKLKFMLSSLLVLSVPYATKNILMGLTEWLTVIFLVCFAWFYFYKKQWLTAFVFLAFVPFLRQNLLPPVFAILFIHFISQKFDYRILVVFVLILLLPVYHNLYYAGEFRFFTSVFEWPFIEYNDGQPTALNINKMLINLIHYTGFNIRGAKIDFLEEAVLFLLFFVFFYFYAGVYLKIRTNKYAYYLTTLVTIIIPTLFLATDFYPRFEFICIIVSVIIFIQVYILDCKNPLFIKRKDSIVASC